MKYPDINIKMKYPNKLINADAPKIPKWSTNKSKEQGKEMVI